MRRLFALLVLLATSCAAPTATHQRANASQGEPGVTGRADLVTPADVREIVVAARAKLASVAPWLRVFRVRVVAQTRVDAYVGIQYDIGDVLHFVLQKTNGQWKVVSVSKEPNFFYEEGMNIIVT